jgi:hypothetical protein
MMNNGTSFVGLPRSQSAPYYYSPYAALAAPIQPGRDSDEAPYGFGGGEELTYEQLDPEFDYVPEQPGNAQDIGGGRPDDLHRMCSFQDRYEAELGDGAELGQQQPHLWYEPGDLHSLNDPSPLHGPNMFYQEREQAPIVGSGKYQAPYK